MPATGEALTTYGGGRKPVASLAETLTEPVEVAKEFVEEPTRSRIQSQLPTVKESPATLIEKVLVGHSDVAQVFGSDVAVQGARSALNEVISTGEFLVTSPVGLATLATAGAGPIASRVISGKFFYDTIKQAVQQSEDLSRNWKAMTPTERTDALVRLAASGTLSLLLGRSTVKGFGATEKLAPLTTAAVEQTQVVKPPVIPAPELKPAVKTMDQEVIEGKAGETHNDIIEQNKLQAQDIDQRVFTDEKGNVLTREQAAAARPELPTAVEPGKLHSTDLPKAKPAPIVEGKAEPEAVPPAAPAVSEAKEGAVTAAPSEPAISEPTTEVTSAQAPIGPGMGGAVASEFEQPGTYVSNMFAAIDRDRAEMGKSPMEKAKGRTWDEDNSRALAQMNRDPEWIPNLIKSVLEKPRPLLSWENAGLVWQRAKWKAEANNAYKRVAQAFDDGRTDALAEAKVDAVRYEDSLEQLDRAVGRGGTGSEAGRTLQAQKMGAGPDFTLVEMRLATRAAKGGQGLTPAEDATVAALHKKITETQQAYDTHVAQARKRIADLESRLAMAEIARSAKVEPKIPSVILRAAERLVSQLDSKADAARLRIKARMSRMTAGVDPTVLLDLTEIGASHIAHIGLDFAKWSAKMIEDVGDWARPHLAQVFKSAQETIDRLSVPEQVKRTVKKVTPEQERAQVVDAIREKADKGEKQKITWYVQKLARDLYNSGVTEREAMIDALHGILEDAIPGITRRETADAFSGYGDYKQLRKDEITVALRGMKGELQQIAKLEDMAAGKPPLKTGVERRTPTEAERQLIKLVNDAKYKFQVPVEDPEVQLKSALDTLKTTFRNRITDYQDRLARKDFAPRPRREVILDKEAMSLKAENERVKRQYQQGLNQYRLAQRNKAQKLADAFVKWERAFKLSSPVVFGKLTNAAATRVLATTLEEAVGGVLSKVPVISTIAKQAPREGGLNIKAMAKGMTEALTTGMKDAWDTAKKGAAEIDVVYGEKLMDQDWANVFGQIHGALKAPVKRGEFTLSLEKRIEHAIRNGVDVTDQLVQTRLATEALNDGYRSVFMQRGFTSDMFNAFVSQMEKSKKYPVGGYISAKVMRFIFPIVRVPINIVAETATGVYGVPVASARTMFHVMNGTLGKLDPVVADSIMRQFKKGSIGLGLMAVGYFNPDMVGGYDWREKREPGTAKTAGFRVAGIDIPRWMTHAPWFELMQIGATIRHVKDQHVKGEEKGIGEGLWAAGLGLIEETPFIGQMTRVDRAFQSSAGRTAYVGELAKSTIIPQAVIKAAEILDRQRGKIKPTTVLEHVKAGIPFVRETVPHRLQ